VQVLKSVVYDGLIRTNEKIYDLLCLGKSLQQSIDGDVKSFPFHYIDWDEPENNVFHVTDEFTVERTGSHETRHPDIVLFVNGIPFAVIECKRPSIKDPITEAISQHIRNQRDAEIPKLFLYSQLLMALSKNEAQFGTTATPAKFWAVWKEREDINAQLLEFIKHLDELYGKIKRYGIKEPTLKVRKMTKRWGSCTGSRAILLNIELVKAPMHCIEYVIMHELCHLLVPKHGEKFRRVLSRCMPDWERRKQRLDMVVL